MKVLERIFEHRIRQQIKIDDMQFGFMKGKGTTDAIFMARQMQESYWTMWSEDSLIHIEFKMSWKNTVSLIYHSVLLSSEYHPIPSEAQSQLICKKQQNKCCYIKLLQVSNYVWYT